MIFHLFIALYKIDRQLIVPSCDIGKVYKLISQKHCYFLLAISGSEAGNSFSGIETKFSPNLNVKSEASNFFAKLQTTPEASNMIYVLTLGSFRRV